MKSKKKIALASVCLICLAVIFSSCKTQCCNYINDGSGQAADEAAAPVLYDVKRVVDGDTIVLDINGTETTVRLIGIDTPESVNPDAKKNTPYGEIASEYTNNLLSGQQVSLEYDKETTDKYGRTLAYVYLGNEMVNKKLLEEGHATVLIVPPNISCLKEFNKLQSEAKRNIKGLWAEQ